MWFDYFSLQALFDKQMSARDTGEAQDFMMLVASEPTELICPRCSAALLARTKEGITVEWCDSCRGIYLDREEIDEILAWRRKRLRDTRRADAKKMAAGVGKSLLEGLESDHSRSVSALMDALLVILLVPQRRGRRPQSASAKPVDDPGSAGEMGGDLDGRPSRAGGRRRRQGDDPRHRRRVQKQVSRFEGELAESM